MKNELLFHGHVAVPLENTAKRFFEGWELADSYRNKYCSADGIEGGSFAETMILLILLDRVSYENDEEISTESAAEMDERTRRFIGRCSQYIGMGKSSIPDDEAKALYEEFKALYIEE